MYAERILNDRNSLRLLPATAFRTVYDDNDPPAADPPANDDPPPPPPPPDAKADKAKSKPKVEFTPEQQAYLNSLLAEERRKNKTVVDRMVTQLETEKNRAGTTQAEKEALEQRIEELRNSQLTAEELRKKDEKKRQEKWEKDLREANQKAEHWERMFTTTTIQRELTSAAVSAKAYNPKHVVNELAPVTRLVPELDEENKPTGNLIPRVKVSTVKDGRPVPMEMTVTEAVKWMSEQDEHAPLFNSGATGGLGGSPNNPSRRGRDADAPPDDPAEYVEWRRKHRGFSGAPRR